MVQGSTLAVTPMPVTDSTIQSFRYWSSPSIKSSIKEGLRESLCLVLRKKLPKNNFLGWLSSAESVWDIASAWRLSDYMGPSWVSQSTWAPPRTALCQDQRLEPVLRQSALVHDLTLHDRTALRWKLEQEKRLWIAFCTRQPKPTAETCSHVGHDLHGQFEQEGELTPIPDVHTHTHTLMPLPQVMA